MDVNPIIEMDFEPMVRGEYQNDGRVSAKEPNGFISAVMWACLGQAAETTQPSRQFAAF